MRNSKFTLNMFILIVTIFSVLIFFFTLVIAHLADRSVINDFYQIEGTDLAIVYSSAKPNGIYQGLRTTAVLKKEGDYGHDWGVVLEGGELYINEYSYTTLGMMFTKVVRVNTEDYEEEVLFDNSILRGRCASGELVCLEGFIMPSAFPRTNSLCRLYSMAVSGLRPESSSVKVLFVDPEDASVVYSTEIDEVSDDFEELFLERTLDEIRK